MIYFLSVNNLMFFLLVLVLCKNGKGVPVWFVIFKLVYKSSIITLQRDADACGPNIYTSVTSSRKLRKPIFNKEV